MALELPPGRRWSFETLWKLAHQIPPSFCQMTREEVMWVARTEAEGIHRQRLHWHAKSWGYYPSARDINRLRKMDAHNFVDTCNKSVPIYILPAFDRLLLNMVLHNHVYRRWFKPYRSEIEYQRFLYKSIMPIDLPDEYPPSHSTINTIVSLNRAICVKVETARRKCDSLIASGKQHCASYWGSVEETRFHILQPLFRAILIIISPQDYQREDSEAIGRFPVLLVLTGITDGLSAPITFDSIANDVERYGEETPETVKTTFKTAIDFVMDLEVREATAFGLQPDPVASWKPSHCIFKDWKETGAGEAPAGPSSRFVDMEKFPQWAGSGQWYDSSLMVRLEKREFWMNSLRHNMAESNEM